MGNGEINLKLTKVLLLVKVDVKPDILMQNRKYEIKNQQ